MGIHVALHHKTSYLYDRAVMLSPHIVRLRPAPHCRTTILSYSQTITPEEHFINWQQDPFSNYLARLVFPEKTREFHVEIDLTADMTVINPFDFFLDPYAEHFPFKYEESLKEDLRPYLRVSEPHPLVKEYLKGIDRGKCRIVDFLVAINQALQKEVGYLIRMEPNVQSPERTLKLKSGSCRDSAWLLVHILRHLGLAARFVSGYLIQLAPDVKALDGPSGPESDFTDLHAWTEVYIPGAGWIGLDPTSGLLAGEGHIPLACSPEPQSASPITGALDECEVDFSHAMKVARIFEAPRSTRPYPEEVWKQIHDLGFKVDEELNANDVRLTMGGEPTFVSIDDMEGAEWNTDAVGPAKRALAANLIKRLKKKWAPGGLLHYGQGKWYPGESLPRWAFSCFWRKDGKPIWLDDALVADEEKDYGFGAEQAQTFIMSLAEELGLDPQYIQPAYEDVFYFLWKEQRLPVNVTPEKSKLKDPEERTRMTRVFEQGLGEVTGYVLPIKHGSWKTGPWPFRGERMFLIPGDSPAGLRLPLESLPWLPPGRYPHVTPADPMAPRGPMPGFHDGQMAVPGAQEDGARQEESPQPRKPGKESPPSGDALAEDVRTALCVQHREGRLYVFMPPLEEAEHYFELTAAIEAVCKKTGMPVIIEGYPPPYDPRVNVLKITPDPGVIEANIHPASSWEEMVSVTTELYEEARLCRLGSQKFLLDGRNTGTGGGNHVVLGGATPQDSPFLRRPDLVRSIVSYFNNHPSLSYLFSGLFLGPTSQRPRIDEARHDSLFELEIAFRELDRQMEIYGQCPPWLTDRLFRNILVDVTGNTHRTEFCIDKLYSPDSSSGRLGLLEIRAFEMPPHARMSLAQQLLLRTLISWFWKKPYRASLARWGTRLMDQFSLPHFVEQDLNDVLEELNDNGYAFKKEFFHPHFEYRFPAFGSVQFKNLTLEIRQAIEPWHVLGEEPGGGGTVRFVDSSLERVQVKLSGGEDSRYMVTCNQRRVPLTATGEQGTYVAGVRYRAWQPPNCLHPTIGVHAPLTFDVIDVWNMRPVAGCSYHVGHPGGRNYERFPVNENEAEGRRISRFIPFAHSPGKLGVLPELKTNKEFPYTLDLRMP
ncbi:Uncharacterized conserved protein, DUF2126 family [Desulfatibacillum alkenivorans DSM 16219]|jgi:uncharacterized protein (DUF2126 family)|uniref:Uncharacterized conserved protein, DUF2126 family n=1 Tax=Desulfatibacillum alkenivorans DSM 16219 TaxID=1121393 RepID=A0A1M6I9K7_9BACT|nr:transglutaminase family protein [Desulfatibacillum alkenivorans]SHJ31189.1 Uncharacterized conserved protein, DUF2126 family [Desulfatibacillum alkenivorans DSM 16219]